MINPDKSALRQKYLDAYEAANRRSLDDILGYENGWWVFRSNVGYSVVRRARHTTLAEWTQVLLDRAFRADNKKH
jgi:hypothetical protein